MAAVTPEQPKELDLPESIRLPSSLQQLVDEFVAACAPRALVPGPQIPGMPTDREVVRAILSLTGAMQQSFPTGGVPALSTSEAGRRLLDLPPADKMRVALNAYVSFSLGTAWSSPLERIFSDLLRAKLDVDADQVLHLVEASKRLVRSHRYERISSILSALRRYVEKAHVEPAVREALADLRQFLLVSNCDSHEPGRKIVKALDAMLAPAPQDDAEPAFRPKPDPWGEAVVTKLAALETDERSALVPFLQLAAEGGEAAKPAKAWLKRARSELDRADRETIGTLLLDFIAAYDPTQRARWAGRSTLSLENQHTLRAMLWLAGMAASQSASRRLEAFARTYLTWVGFDYYSLVLGNAAIFALTLMPGTDGVAGLSRLKHHLKRPGEIKTIDRALTTLAETVHIAAGELEELALPDYGFDSVGKHALEIGPATVHLAITPASALTMEWRVAGAEPSSAPPAILKETHTDALAEFKAKAKEIEDTLRAQRLRFERLYLEERTWPLAVWRERYLNAPLVAALTRRLIWSFETGGRWVTGFVEGDRILDVAGSALAFEGEALRVRLWHPMQCEAAEVLAWRQRLASLQITQPFKQAHREVYVLTDAERETKTHSSRFAAHVVDQHLFRAVAQARGWKSPLAGRWNSKSGFPSKELPDHGLRVEFVVAPVEDERKKEDKAHFDYLSTGQVRFVKFLGNAVPQEVKLRDGSTFGFEGPLSVPVALTDVGPVLFSEMMRDADFFVAASSIANDPAWNERRRGFADYWTQASFGGIGEIGKARRAALADLLPPLAIASRCRLEDRYLVVAGKLATYRIHLGSANVQMEPNDQHLCILPDKAPRLANDVRLPFEDDPTLSLILAKAFMLADDDKIKDRSIRAQIQSL